MPQITVTEIDQSVVTRVVSDDKVKVLCPILASFGPGYDGTQNSIQTFTDVTDFNRAYGYTYAEFNPFPDDYSRMYARELIKKGAAVSIVRLNNNGLASVFELGGYGGATGEDRSTPSVLTIPLSVVPSILAEDTDDAVHASTITTTTTLNNDDASAPIPGSIIAVISATEEYPETGDIVKVVSGSTTTYESYIYDKDGAKIATISYGTTVSITPATGVTLSDAKWKTLKANTAYKYTFCPQVKGIEAKYPGSFGNNIMISISQVNTSRLAESYQYAVVSVYYVNQEVNYNDDGAVASRVVKSTTLLENKRISTNPNSANYFEDVEFDFIKIIPTDTAREELALIWSNIEAAPMSTQRYSGFPVIPFKYKKNGSYTTNYNFNAFFTKTFGTDFMYTDDTLAKLRSGYKYFWSGTGTLWSAEDVTKYVEEVYGDGTNPGIVAGILTNLAALYENFTDPYIYDFDFITSSGITYEEWKVVPGGDIKVSDAEFTSGTPIASIPSGAYIVPGTVTAKVTVDEEGKTYIDKDKDGKLYEYVDGSYVIATDCTVNYSTNTVTLATGTTPVSVSFAYPDISGNVIPKTAVPTLITPENNMAYKDVTPVHQAMRALVETRQDCIALFDVPHDYDRKEIVEYSRLLNTSYGTMHFPWCWVNSPDIAGKQIMMAPSYIFLYTFLSNLINNVESQKWFPPAGVERATARVVVRPDFEVNSVLLNEWQNDNTSRVNPIMKLKQYGYVIYGQYTTLEAIDLYTHSALESLNVRLIADVVKKKIFDACLTLAFQPNTQKLWLQFFAIMDEYLRYMKYNEGVYDYRIVMDESTVTTDDINHLRCPGKVYIAPTRTAEFFDIDFILTDAGAEFSD